MFYKTEIPKLINEWEIKIKQLIENLNSASLKEDVVKKVKISKKSDLTVAITIPQAIKNEVLKLLAAEPVVRHIQKEEKFNPPNTAKYKNNRNAAATLNHK